MRIARKPLLESLEQHVIPLLADPVQAIQTSLSHLPEGSSDPSLHVLIALHGANTLDRAAALTLNLLEDAHYLGDTLPVLRSVLTDSFKTSKGVEYNRLSRALAGRLDVRDGKSTCRYSKAVTVIPGSDLAALRGSEPVKEFAARVKVHHASIRRWESGVLPLSVQRFVLLQQRAGQ